MVQITVDTGKDSPETIKKIIEILHVALGNKFTSGVSSRVYENSFAPVRSSSSSFEVFNASSSQSHPLPSSAPVSSESSIFDVFGSEDRVNTQSSQTASSNPIALFDKPASSTTAKNNSADFTNNNIFDSFSKDLPSTDFTSSTSSPQSTGLEASFVSAQSLLDDNFNPLQDVDEKHKPEEKPSNFFNFEQY